MQIETWEQYVGLAIRTAKPLPFEKQIEHARLGMLTEIGELADVYKRHIIYGKPFDDVNFREEVGDLCWYVALEAHTAKLSLVIHAPREALPQEMDSVFTVGRLVGANLSSDPSHSMRLETLLYRLRTLCHGRNVDMMQCLGLNIAKLAKRYGDKYSDQAALVRDLIAERELLEAGKA